MHLNKTPEKKETIKIVYDDFQFRLDLTVKQKKKAIKVWYGTWWRKFILFSCVQNTDASGINSDIYSAGFEE